MIRIKPLDNILLKVTKKISERASGIVGVVSFFLLLNILDMLIKDEKTYGVAGAIALVIWMVVATRLAELYRREN